MTDNENTHFSHIKVKGFKSIGELDLEMRSINILIGANGSGKSNFISLFTFLRNLSEGRLQRYVEKQGFASSFFHFGVKTTQKIIIDIEAGMNGYHVAFEHGVYDDTLVFIEEHCQISLRPELLISMSGTKGESGLIPLNAEDLQDSLDALSLSSRKQEVLNTRLEDKKIEDAQQRIQSKFLTLKYLNGCRAYHFHDTSQTAAFKQASELSEADYLYSNASNLASFLFRLKNTGRAESIKSYKDIVAAIKTVAPYFLDFYLEPRGSEGEQKILLKWLHRDHGEPFSANQLSDGTARFICMATLFLQPSFLRPKIIILDEPELGLHPAGLEVLADIMKSVSKESQVICSTQSVTFANQFEADDFIVVDQVKGASVFKRPDAESLVAWLEDYSMGDIWSKNLIGGRPEW